LIKIDEVYPGSVAAPNAQFVELQMYFDGQNQVQGKSLVIRDSDNVLKGTFTFTSNVPNDANHATILIATTEAEAAFGVEADLTMTPEIGLIGGSACWAVTVDCVTWGNYEGPTEGQPFAPGGLTPGQSMQRKHAGGSNPNALDEGDDTGNNVTDFKLADPTPKPNPLPPREKHPRTISLSFGRHMKAKGKVTVEGFKPCKSHVPVKVQRKVSGTWKTVKNTQTDGTGSYATTIPKHSGNYRSVAPKTTPGTADLCKKAISGVVHHS
jgi:hypothetical protein